MIHIIDAYSDVYEVQIDDFERANQELARIVRILKKLLKSTTDIFVPNDHAMIATSYERRIFIQALLGTRQFTRKSIEEIYLGQDISDELICVGDGDVRMIRKNKRMLAREQIS